MQTVVAIVDGLNAGKFFPVNLQKRGLECIHISSLPRQAAKYDKTLYSDCFVAQSTVAATLHQVMQTYRLTAVIAGSESGVLLAHNLAKALDLRRNQDKLVQATRDKYLMQQTLKNHRIPFTESVKSGDLETILAWVQQHGAYPVVVKPVDSGGSDKVYICYDWNQVESAYHEIRSTETIYGHHSTAVLIQEYLSGSEYVVNLVSFAGEHFLLEIRQYHKQNFNG